MKKYFFPALFIMICGLAQAQVKVSNMFDNNMVLQREKPVKVWGWAAPGEEVKVEFDGQTHAAVTDKKGEWNIVLQSMKANTRPQTLKITGKSNQIVYSNILVGDVWLLGGQSNMEFDLNKVYDGDLEVLSSDNDLIRLFTVPYASSAREKVSDLKRGSEFNSWSGEYEDKGTWFPCYADKVSQFSAIGYMFGKTLQQITGIPVGLIDVSRGGTTIESWLSPQTLEAVAENDELMKMWNRQAEEYDPEKVLQKEIASWEKRSESRRKQGLEVGPKPTEPTPSPLESQLFPGACYNGMLYPVIGFAIKGVIFNHGYNNALGDARPKLYAIDFDAMIKDWRKAFDDQDLPFGIIELTAGGEPQTDDNFEACMLDAAPFIREGQYRAYENNGNVGYCCAYDQQVNWYHPQKKLPLGVRMARWALATVYGYGQVVWEPAKVLSTEISGGSIVVTFDKEVKGSDDRPIEGFALSGKDRHFYPAKAEYVKKDGRDSRGNQQYDKTKLVISHPLVKNPVAVRYAWARNPIGNMVSDRIIPVPLFRTDHWDHPEAPYLDWDSEGFAAYRSQERADKKKAAESTGTRQKKEASFLMKNR